MARARVAPAEATGSAKRIAVGLLECATALWVLCSKGAVRASRKLRIDSAKVAPRSKQLLTAISNKAMHFRHRKRAPGEEFQLDGGDMDDGGVWQRSILMGDKCQPLDFSGVIYYDSKGNQVSGLPMRSPRASPLPSDVDSSVKP
ncbi:hypothetical protein NMG60_11024022 [Bertholletia excelsa]